MRGASKLRLIRISSSLGVVISSDFFCVLDMVISPFAW